MSFFSVITQVNHQVTDIYDTYSPGAIYTSIQANTREAKQMEKWGGNAGLGRPGEPSEVAITFMFLASADVSLYCKLSYYRHGMSSGS